MSECWNRAVDYRRLAGDKFEVMVRTFRSTFSCLVANLGHIPLFCAHFGGLSPCLVANLGRIPLFYAHMRGSPPLFCTKSWAAR